MDSLDRDMTTTGTPSIGRRLRAWRLDHDLTQGELAEQLNVRHATISDWERCRKLPRGPMLRRLLEFIDAPDDVVDVVCREIAMNEFV